MAHEVRRDRVAIQAYLSQFDIDPNRVLEEGLSSRGYYSWPVRGGESRLGDPKEFHAWPEGFDWKYFDSIVSPNVSNQDDYPGEWSRNGLRQLILSVLVELELTKVEN